MVHTALGSEGDWPERCSAFCMSVSETRRYGGHEFEFRSSAVVWEGWDNACKKLFAEHYLKSQNGAIYSDK